MASATARAFAHATEDVERIRRCVRALVGDDVELRERRSRGFHHQPLRVLEGELRGSRRLRDLLARLGTEEVLEDYARTWERRLDEDDGVVHFRLAKQSLLEGRLELERASGEGDLVKLELKLLAYPSSPQGYRAVAEALFSL